MGLHISRETLTRVGLRLTLDPTPSDAGAVFRISPASDDRVAQTPESP